MSLLLILRTRNLDKYLNQLEFNLIVAYYNNNKLINNVKIIQKIKEIPQKIMIKGIIYIYIYIYIYSINYD